MANKKRPKVGIGVLVLKKGKVLLGKRKGSSHGKGEYIEVLKEGKNFFDS